MNENVEKVSSLLQKKIVPSSSSGYNESAMLCGIEKMNRHLLHLKKAPSIMIIEPISKSSLLN